MRSGRVLRGAAVAAALVLAYVAGSAGGNGARKPADAAVPSVLDQALDRISGQAASPVPKAELEQAAITAMLRRLGDRWAQYYTAQEFDDAAGRLTGHYTGVGLWLGTADGSPVIRVASVQPGSAAASSGVRAGDEITGVNGSSVAGWPVTKIALALRGRPGTSVALSVRRGTSPLSFSLVRTALRSGDVVAREDPGGVQVIQVLAFTQGVGARVRSLVSRPSSGILLDLRGDPGGLLDEAVQTASAFLAGGPVVTYERRGAAPQRIDVTVPGNATTPLVVLVDAGTASAAEIVAGSLRDRDRAVIVGSRTFGKGSVQEPVRLGDGSAIELTVGRYLTPGGRNLDGVGIDPDVEISADRSPQEAEQRALGVLRGLASAGLSGSSGKPGNLKGKG